MDAATNDTLGQLLLVNLEFEDLVNANLSLLEHGIELLSLGNVSWEAIEEDSTLALWIAQVVANETNDELIWHKLTSLHDSISLLAQLGALLDSLTEHVSRGQVADAEIVSDLGSLGSLARAWGSNHDNVGGWALGALISSLDLAEEIVKADVSQIHFYLLSPHKNLVFICNKTYLSRPK